MEYKLVFAETATNDLNEIADYIAKDSEIAATKIYRTLRKKAESLVFMPKRGIQRNEIVDGGHMILAGSYYIYYQIVGSIVTVLRILHQSRNVHGMLE